MPASASWFDSALATLVARAGLYGAAFAALWLATQLFGKAEYGSYVFAIALVWFVSFPATLGLDQVVSVRVARGEEASALITAALWTSLGIGAGLALLLAAAAPALGALSSLPGLGLWLAGLAVTVPLLAMMSVLEAWFIASGRVAAGQYYPLSGQLLRVPLLALALGYGGGVPAVIGLEILVALLPLVLFALDSRRPPLGLRPKLQPGQIRLGLQLLVSRLAFEGTRRIDLLMLGVLGTALAVADFGIALRLVIVVELGRDLLLPALQSRMGRLLAGRDTAGVAQTYRLTRAVALVVGLFAAAGIALLGQPVLGLFGSYESAYAPLMLLVAGALVNIGFGHNAQVLKLAGHAGTLVLIRGLTLIMLFTAELWLIPVLGASGAALAAAAAMLFSNIAMSMVLKRREGLASLDTASTLALGSATLAALLAGFAAVPPVAAGLWLAATALGYGVAERRQAPLLRAAADA